jgi:hypothetical protein
MKHSIYGNANSDYWEYIAAKINSDHGEEFNGKQCRNRFNALVREFYVSTVN